MSDDEFTPLSRTILDLVMLPREKKKAMLKRSFSELGGAFMELGGRHIRETGRRAAEEDETSVIDTDGLERK